MYYRKAMGSLTIPRNIIKNDDLVVMPRREYEQLVHFRELKTREAVRGVKRSSSFRIPKKHEKFYQKIDKELNSALAEYQAGRYYGPFNTAEETIRFLNRS